MRKFCLCLCATAVLSSVAQVHAAAKIQFENTLFDFGHLVGIEYVTGSFKYKNVGDSLLKLDKPHPSCGCTDAKATPDILAPGQTGEVTYRINLDHPMVQGFKAITIVSNDPKTPSVTLKVQFDFDPVYTIETKSVRVVVPAGKEEATESFAISRPDGKPLDIDKIVSSHDWVSAAVDENKGLINVTVKRTPEAPAIFNGTIKLYNSKLAKQSVRTIGVNGQLEGELAATPRGLYWVFADQGDDLKKYPSSALSKTVQLNSILGHQVEIKSAQSSIKGTSVQIVPKEPGKSFDLVLKLDEVPHGFVTGKVTLKTSLASLPEMEVPVTISVFKQ